MNTPGIQTLPHPLWYPPIESRWIFTILIVFAGSIAQRFPDNLRVVFLHPLGFFLVCLAALSSYNVGFPPGAFAIFFFLLMVWSTQLSKQTEGFLHATNAVDWVTTSQRWYVEKVLKERPLGIQEKGVDTFPVQGASSQSVNSSGNT